LACSIAARNFCPGGSGGVWGGGGRGAMISSGSAKSFAGWRKSRQ
jgi:hypothetical protein